MREEVKNYISFVWCRFRRYSHLFRAVTCTQFCPQQPRSRFLTLAKPCHLAGRWWSKLSRAVLSRSYKEGQEVQSREGEGQETYLFPDCGILEDTCKTLLQRFERRARAVNPVTNERMKVRSSIAKHHVERYRRSHRDRQVTP